MRCGRETNTTLEKAMTRTRILLAIAATLAAILGVLPGTASESSTNGPPLLTAAGSNNRLPAGGDRGVSQVVPAEKLNKMLFAKTHDETAIVYTSASTRGPIDLE
jgi:hypothetical protein